ncbi:MAG: hypothetical protein GY936_03950, partial [Ignavibacteriae bacterium]|nr:hypothetical protein [Ignavibacteriota bacterium]
MKYFSFYALDMYYDSDGVVYKRYNFENSSILSYSVVLDNTCNPSEVPLLRKYCLTYLFKRESVDLRSGSNLLVRKSFEEICSKIERVSVDLTDILVKLLNVSGVWSTADVFNPDWLYNKWNFHKYKNSGSYNYSFFPYVLLEGAGSLGGISITLNRKVKKEETVVSSVSITEDQSKSDILNDYFTRKNFPP